MQTYITLHPNFMSRETTKYLMTFLSEGSRNFFLVSEGNQINEWSMVNGSLSPLQARKNHFIWMGLLYGAFGPGTPAGLGGSEMLSRREGVIKWPPGG